MAEFARPGAEQWVPDGAGIDGLRAAAPDCRGCELYRDATQVVFGSGPQEARLALVGEQPGDQEDRQGEPFVGPAGRLLAEALEVAGIDAERVYVTNAVKHFHFEERGKRRIHKSPAVAHITACHPWLRAELRTVRPDVVVALGATAGRAVLGRTVRVTTERGHPLDESPTDAPGSQVVLTIHPSAVLRLRGKPEYDDAFAGLVADLKVAAALLDGPPARREEDR